VPIFACYVALKIYNDFNRLTKSESLDHFNKNSHVGQYLTIGKIISNPISLKHGVPQTKAVLAHRSVCRTGDRLYTMQARFS